MRIFAGTFFIFYFYFLFFVFRLCGFFLRTGNHPSPTHRAPPPPPSLWVFWVVFLERSHIPRKVVSSSSKQAIRLMCVCVYYISLVYVSSRRRSPIPGTRLLCRRFSRPQRHFGSTLSRTVYVRALPCPYRAFLMVTRLVDFPAPPPPFSFVAGIK